LNKKRYDQLCSTRCLIPKPQFKITRTRSTQRNFTVVIGNFWACSCRPIHKRLLLCSVLQVYMCWTKKEKQNKKDPGVFDCNLKKATFSKLLRKIFERFLFLGKYEHFRNFFKTPLKNLPRKILGKEAFLKLLWKRYLKNFRKLCRKAPAWFYKRKLHKIFIKNLLIWQLSWQSFDASRQHQFNHSCTLRA